jgi:hypothetical protein
MQKLFMMNSPFMLKRAKALAVRIAADTDESNAARIARAYRLLYAREAEGDEIQLGLHFLAGASDSAMSRWEQYAQVLLASDEMLYVD